MKSGGASLGRKRHQTLVLHKQARFYLQITHDSPQEALPAATGRALRSLKASYASLSELMIQRPSVQEAAAEFYE